MLIQSEFPGSFEESYHLHPCIKIWIMYVKFALKILDIVDEWRIISVDYMYLKPELFPKATFGVSIVLNAKYAPTGSLFSEIWMSMFFAIMHKYLKYSQRQVLACHNVMVVDLGKGGEREFWKITWCMYMEMFWFQWYFVHDYSEYIVCYWLKGLRHVIECEVCVYAFSSLRNLKTHMRTKHERKW